MDGTSLTLWKNIDIVLNKITEIITTTRPYVETSPQIFIHEHVMKLKLISTYAQFFKTISVVSRKDAEKIWTSAMVKHKDIEDKLDLLLEKEMEFDNFLTEIDTCLSLNVKSENKVKLGDMIPPEMKVKTLNNK